MSWPIRGLSLGCYWGASSALNISLTMMPAATIVASNPASARSRRRHSRTREKGSSGYRVLQRAVRRSIALNGDAVVGRQPDAKPQAMFLEADPAAGRLESFLAPGNLGTLGTSVSIPSRRMPLEAAEHHYREDHTHPEDDRPKNVALNVGIKRPNQLSDVCSLGPRGVPRVVSVSAWPPSARRLSVSGC